MKIFYTFLLVLITCQAFGNSLRLFEEESLEFSARNVSSFVEEYEEVEEQSKIEDAELREDEDASIPNKKRSSKENYLKSHLLDTLKLIGLVILAFGIGLFVGFLLAKARFRDDFKLAKANPQIRKTLKNLESENLGLKQRISKLESEKTEFESRRSYSNTEKQKSNDEITESKVNLDTVQQRITDNAPPKSSDQEINQNSISIYFQYPEANGSFHKDHGTSLKGDRSYFEIVFKKDHSEGELKFVADRSNYGRILSVRDTSLGPVSEIENPGDVERPTNISVIKNGVVEIRDDRFIIKEGYKLKIKIS